MNEIAQSFAPFLPIVDRENPIDLGIDTRTSPKESVVRYASTKLGIASSYDQKTGVIHVDDTLGRKGRITAAMSDARVLHSRIIGASLALESEVLRRQIGKDVKVATMEEYIKTLAANHLLSSKDYHKDYLGDEVKLMGLTSGLVEHWVNAVYQIHNHLNGASDFESFLSDDDRILRMSRWHLKAYFEDEPNGGWNLDVYTSLPLSMFSKLSTKYLKQPEAKKWITHTAPLPAAVAIADSGYLLGLRNNCSIGRVVCKYGVDSSVTFVFRADDLLTAAPFIMGHSGASGENEITSYFPVPVRVAAAVVPTDLIDKHHDYIGKYSQGTYSGQLDADLIKAS